MEKELFHRKNYKFHTEQGTEVEITVEAKIKDVNKRDLENILHEVARCTHNFYLSLGRKIASGN